MATYIRKILQPVEPSVDALGNILFDTQCYIEDELTAVQTVIGGKHATATIPRKDIEAILDLPDKEFVAELRLLILKARPEFEDDVLEAHLAQQEEDTAENEATATTADEVNAKLGEFPVDVLMS